MKNKKLSTLKIEQIIVDKLLYPRINASWQTAYDYAMSIKAGAHFPPIEVALFKNKYYLVDGNHRLLANKQLKETHIQALVIQGLTKKQIYQEAVKANIIHGRQFSTQEKANIIHNFKEMGFSFNEISSMVLIPLDKIEGFVAKRCTNTAQGLFIPLKAPVNNFAGIEVDDDFEFQQKPFASHSQINVLDQMISLLENKLFDLKNSKVVEKLEKVKSLL